MHKAVLTLEPDASTRWLKPQQYNFFLHIQQSFGLFLQWICLFHLLCFLFISFLSAFIRHILFLRIVLVTGVEDARTNLHLTDLATGHNFKWKRCVRNTCLCIKKNDLMVLHHFPACVPAIKVENKKCCVVRCNHIIP